MSAEIPPIPDPQPNPEIPPVISLPVPETLEMSVAVEPPAELARPWGFWATLGWGFLSWLAAEIAKAGIIIGGGIVGAFGKPMGKLTKADFESNGLMTSLTLIAGTPVLCGLVVVIARLRRNMDLRSYLGLQWPDLKSCLRWTGAMIILVALTDTTTTLIGKSIVPEFMVNVYKSAGFLPLLWLAIIVAAPVGEELFFRGFMLEGLRHSRVGGTGAILITSFLWAALHLQYDVYGMGSIFASGLLLGCVRLRTGSVLLCIGLHALMNLIATAELLIYMRMKVL